MLRLIQFRYELIVYTHKHKRQKNIALFFLPSLFIVSSVPPKVIVDAVAVAVTVVLAFFYSSSCIFNFFSTPRCTLSVTLIRFCVFISFSSILLLLLLGLLLLGVGWLLAFALLLSGIMYGLLCYSFSMHVVCLLNVFM